MDISRFAPRLTAMLLLILVLVIVLPGTASAHERRRVGSFSFYVGLLIEPAFAYERNAVYVAIRDGVTTAEITGAETTLRAVVIIDGKSTPIGIVPIEGAPGAYQADFTPIATGPVTIHFTGSVRGESINAEFASGPSTFNSIEPGDPAKAPVNMPATAPASPSGGFVGGVLAAGVAIAGMALFVWHRRHK